MEPLLQFLRVQGGALLGFASGLLVARLARRTDWGRRPRRWAGLALVLALVGAFLAQYGLPALPFGEDRLRSHERLFWMLIPAVIACLSAWRHALLPVALFLPLVATATVTGWDLEAAGLTERLVLPAGFVLLAASGDAVFRRRSGFPAALALGLVVSVSAGAIGATGSASYATWLGGLGLAWGLAVLLAWRRWDANLLDGATLMTWTAGFLLLGTTYSELTPIDAGLLASALPLSLLVESLVEGKAKRLMGWAALLAPLALALLRIALSFESDPYAGY